uniref:Uncharacterized protein n=1 Tax=Ananas comosus var. bracteatus TaxID=296719 RepID=A0A6V7NXT2_ANACO|nr:unnamed protein product [Ananas comosus var. bracteatus]
MLTTTGPLGTMQAGLPRSPESFYSRGPVPEGRDRSPCEQCCAAVEATGPWQSRPVPERVCAGRDRSRAGRDRFPNVGFSGSQRETGPCWERPVPLGENCPVRADREKGKEKKKKKRRRSLLGGLGASPSSPFSHLGGFELAVEALWRTQLQPYLVLSLD